jgi:hypothetical protein
MSNTAVYAFSGIRITEKKRWRFEIAREIREENTTAQHEPII